FQQQDRDVERAAPQVVHGEQAVLLLVEAVGQRRSRWLVQEPQDLEPARRPASLVAWRCASSKYAGTVMTAPPTLRSWSTALCLRLLRISALTSTGVMARPTSKRTLRA